MHAANIGIAGIACLGGFAERLPSAVRGYRFYEAITMAISCVERVNINDSNGQHVNAWPRVEVEIDANGVARRKKVSTLEV